LPFEEIEHQALSSTLFGAVTGKAVDRQRLWVRLLIHIYAPSSFVAPASNVLET
jgi:hypothetical protein